MYKMPHNLRDRVTSAHRLTFLHFLLLLEDFSSLCHDVGVSQLTQAEHREPGFCCIDDSTESLCGDSQYANNKKRKKETQLVNTLTVNTLT